MFPSVRERAMAFATGQPLASQSPTSRNHEKVAPPSPRTVSESAPSKPLPLKKSMASKPEPSKPASPKPAPSPTTPSKRKSSKTTAPSKATPSKAKPTPTKIAPPKLVRSTSETSSSASSSASDNDAPEHAAPPEIAELKAACLRQAKTITGLHGRSLAITLRRTSASANEWYAALKDTGSNKYLKMWMNRTKTYPTQVEALEAYLVFIRKMKMNCRLFPPMSPRAGKSK